MPSRAIENTSTFHRAELFRHWVDRIVFSKGAADIVDPDAFVSSDDSRDDSPDLVLRSYDAASPLAGANLAWSPRHAFTDQVGLEGSLSVTAPEQHSLLSVPDVGWRFVGSGDFNRDRRMDFVLRDMRDPLAQSTGLWFGLTDDPVQPIQWVFVSPGVVAKEWEVKGVADIDQDGVSDLIWQLQNTPNYAIWAMNELSGTTPPGQIVRGRAILAAEPDSGWELIGAADVDHYQVLADGSLRVDARPLAPDLFFRNFTTGAFRLRRMVWANGGYVRHPNPDPMLFAPNQADPATTVPAVLGVQWRLVSVADYNNDGFADLIWQCVDQTACGSDFDRLLVWARLGFETFSLGTPKDRFAFAPLPFQCLGVNPCRVPSGAGWQGAAPR